MTDLDNSEIDEEDFYDEDYQFDFSDEEDNIEEEHTDNSFNFDERYILNFIQTKQINSDCVPESVKIKEEQLNSYPTANYRLRVFEDRLPDLKTQIPEDKFFNDESLKAIIDEFNKKLLKKKLSKIELEPLYYFTLYIYEIVCQRAFNSFKILPRKFDQIKEAIDLALKEGSEIIIRGLEKGQRIVITDREIIDFLLNAERINSIIKEKENISLNISKIDLDGREKELSKTNRGAIFSGIMFEYFDMGYSSYKLIAYLLYFCGWHNKFKLTDDKNYISILLNRFKEMSKEDKDKLDIIFNITD